MKLFHESCVKISVTFVMGIKVILVYFGCVLAPWRKCVSKSEGIGSNHSSGDQLNSPIKKLLN